MGKDDLLTKGAILQRDQETYAITARLLGGVMDVETGRRIADTAEKYGVEMLKVTGDGRLSLIGIKEEDIDAAYEEMGIKAQAGTALCQQYIKVCPGNAYCLRGQKDTIDLARKIDERFYPYPKISSKVKIGIAGCFNSCSEPAIKDIGLIGLLKGWILMVGGAGGKEPMIAETIARNLSDDDVLEIMDKLLKYYRGVSDRPQTRNLRLGVILKKEGKERLLRVCGLD
ncbi:MAG TPA: NAD(P)/FAD-dependent oxidoreductase [Deltaproteobacteria bacterium]|nr:NAD(P)/FAD-dependent oxidoreductase [Deltaproteobacteria bacterium]